MSKQLVEELTLHRTLADGTTVKSKAVKLSDGRLFTLIDRNKMSRLMTHHLENGGIILSAERENYPPEVNAERTESLRKDIRAAGFGFIESAGGYRYENGEVSVETSFIVPKPKSVDDVEIYQFSLDMCRKYEQESVLVELKSLNEGKPTYIDRNGNSTFGFDTARITRPEDEYYTKTIKNKETPSFTFDSCDLVGVRTADTMNGKVLLKKKGQIIFAEDIK